MSGLDPNGGGALVVPGGGGTSLPTASAAGELPVSDGAGSAYTATSAGDVVDAAIASVVGAVAGQAIVGDGLGGVTETSADVSAVLAAADAAGMRSGLALPASALTAFGTGGDTAWTGWTYSETGGATARTDGSVTGGRLRLTCTAGATLSPDNATFTATIPTALRSRSWRFRARLATMTGGSSFARWVVITDGCYLSIRSDGVVNSGGPSISDAASSAGVIATGGTGWIDATHDAGQTTLRYGTGTSSAEPTSWTVGVAYRHAQHTAEPSTLLFRLEEFGAPGTTLTLEMDHATIGPTEDGGW